MNKIIGGAVILCLFVLTYLYTTQIIFPNTWIGENNISSFTKPKLRKLLSLQKEKKIKIQIQDRVYEYDYEKLGIYLDTEKTLTDVYTQNLAYFPLNIMYLLRSIAVRRTMLPTLTFSQDFYRFTTESVFDLSTAANSITLDQTDKKLIYEENQHRYKIDGDSLRAQIVTNFGKNSVLKPKLADL